MEWTPLRIVGSAIAGIIGVIGWAVSDITSILLAMLVIYIFK